MRRFNMVTQITRMSVKGKTRNVHLMTEYDDGSWSAKVNVGKNTVYGVVKTNSVGARRFYPTTGLNSELL
jgi:hypothetical protein